MKRYKIQRTVYFRVPVKIGANSKETFNNCIREVRKGVGWRSGGFDYFMDFGKPVLMKKGTHE